ncbi:MAG: Hsp20/alpha crystallin family protein [candidate division WOR-3 bacterium]
MEHTVKEIQKKEADSPKGVEHTRSQKIYTPNVDIIERSDDILLIADMPGVDEKTVDIGLDNNVLSIYGRVDPEIPENYKLTVAEYGIGDYQRSFTLTDEVDSDKIQATVKNGVLKIILPKAEKVKARKIAVKAEA